MKRYFSLILIFTGCLLFSSCLKIEELVHFNKDFSGKYKMTVDMSEMMGMMSMFSGMMGEEGGEGMGGFDLKSLGGADVTKGMDSMVDVLAKINGINNVKMDFDNKTFKTNYEFEFKDIDALNKALRIAQANQLFSKGEGKDMFTLKGNKLYRNENESLKELMGENSMDGMEGLGDLGNLFGDEEEEGKKSKKKKDDEEGKMDKMMGAFMGDITYTSIYEFEQPVKKSKNKSAEVDNNTVKLVFYPMEEEKNGKMGMANRITLAK